METVHCLASSQVRVSCTMSCSRPARIISVCRATSKSTARDMALNEFMFFTSTLVPKRSRPFGRTDTFTSHRIEPSLRFPSPTSRYRTKRRSSAPYAATSRPVRRSGSVTISTSATPARL